MKGFLWWIQHKYSLVSWHRCFNAREIYQGILKINILVINHTTMIGVDWSGLVMESILYTYGKHVLRKYNHEEIKHDHTLYEYPVESMCILFCPNETHALHNIKMTNNSRTQHSIHSMCYYKDKALSLLTLLIEFITVHQARVRQHWSKSMETFHSILNSYTNLAWIIFVWYAYFTTFTIFVHYITSSSL